MELHSTELHSMKLHLINRCLSAKIKPNGNIIFFQIPMKINKNTTNTYAYYEKYGK